MNNKRKFLIPLAALASVFVASNASANVNANEPNLSSAGAQLQATTVVGANDVFSFILKTPAQSQFMAEHASHASHASHSSHQSGS